jgi:UV excision repair protein RAD23
MKITLKTIDKKVYSVEVASAETTTEELRALIEKEHGFDAGSQQLIYVGKVLKEGQKLSEFGYKEEQFIVLLMQKAKAAKPAATPPAPTPTPAADPPAEAKPPAETDTPAEAPSAPAAPSAPSEPVPPTEPDTSPAAAPSADTGLGGGPEAEAAVAMIMEMGFERPDVEVAMRAAFMNPERAVEYLMDPSSMPAQAQAPPQNPAAAGIPSNPQQTGIPSNPAAAGAPGGMPEGVPQELQALLQDPQFMQMIQALQQNPQMLPAVLAEIQKSNPALMQTIVQNQAAFMQLLGGGMGGGGGGQGGAGGPPPGAIRITQEEKEALERMEQLFPHIDRTVIFQVYKSCDNNEELACNLLMENAQSFMDEGP